MDEYLYLRKKRHRRIAKIVFGIILVSVITTVVIVKLLGGGDDTTTTPKGTETTSKDNGGGNNTGGENNGDSTTLTKDGITYLKYVGYGSVAFFIVFGLGLLFKYYKRKGKKKEWEKEKNVLNSALKKVEQKAVELRNLIDSETDQSKKGGLEQELQGVKKKIENAQRNIKNHENRY